MATAALIGLTVGSLVVLVLAVALYVSIGEKQLHTAPAIAHDGPRVGRPAPQVRISGIDGTAITVPSGRQQVLLFADHSLLDFEDLLGLLVGDQADRPAVIVLGSSARTSTDLLEGLHLGVPAAVVPHDVYHRYRVRVMPYAVVVDSLGRVTSSRLVNTSYQLRQLAQVRLETVPAGVPPTAGTSP
jgi:hypothetical protein